MVPWIRSRLLVTVLSLCAAACSLLAPTFVKPTVSVADIRWVGGNFLQQNFLVTLSIQNPNDRELPVTGLHADLTVAGERIASGVSNRAFVVPANGTTQFDMSVTANAAMALLKLSQKGARHGDAQADSIDYEMVGAANVDLPFLRNVPFHQSGSLSLRN